MLRLTVRRCRGFAWAWTALFCLVANPAEAFKIGVTACTRDGKICEGYLAEAKGTKIRIFDSDGNLIAFGMVTKRVSRVRAQFKVKPVSPESAPVVPGNHIIVESSITGSAAQYGAAFANP